MLDNLIGNAIKHTAPGGHILLGASPQGDDVVFSVRDTGAGIAAEDVPHVFERFWQAVRTAHSGAGLELAIAKGIVEAHGGRIWVESTPDQGSTFAFTIPTRPNADASRPEASP